MKKMFKKLFKGEKGASEITQSIMLAGASIALVILSLFPNLKIFTGTATDLLTDWFEEQASSMFGGK
jgi:hypothetical protein